MFKKILIPLAIILTIIVLFFTFAWISSRMEDKKNTDLISKCENTDYRVKRLEENKLYSLPQGPNQDKLAVKINKSYYYHDYGDKPIASVSPGIFTGPTFVKCYLSQSFGYNLIFNDELVARVDQSTKNPTTSFEDIMEIRIEDKDLGNTSIDYNFEEKFLNSFKPQTKNGLDLYTDPLLVVDGNSAVTIDDIPRALFPSSTGDQKNYTDFRKNGDKLEITFSLDSRMVRALNDPAKNGFFKEEDYARLWQGGSRTFCFEKKSLYSEKERTRLGNSTENQLDKKYYTLCNKDLQEFKDLLG